MTIKGAVKLLNIFDREIKGVHQAALLLGLMGILTQILSLLRYKILAAKFGAGPMADIYFAAFRIPDALFTLTLFITAAASLIPVFIKENEKGEAQARLFLGRILMIFLIIFTPLFLFAFILTPYLTKLITPGFSAEQTASLNVLTRIMLLSPLFFGLSNITSVVVQSFQKFFIYSLSPLFYNAGIILGITVFYSYFGILGLAWGVAFGAFLHFLIQFPSLMKLKILPKFTFNIFTADLRKTFMAGFFRTLALSLNQFVFIVFTGLASIFPTGSIAVFNYSNSIQSIPLAIIGVSYSLAAFPVLSRFMASGQKESFLENVSSSVRHIIFWSVPLSFFLIVLRAQIVRVVLGTGAFKWTETRLTAAMLALFSLSIAAQSLILLFSRAYYAAGKTKRPLFINSVSSIVIIAFAFIFFFALQNSMMINRVFTENLRLRGLSNIYVLSLPLAYSIGALLNAALLWIYFVRDFKFKDGEILLSFKQNLVSGIALGAVSYLGLQIFSRVFNLETFLGILSQGFLAGILGICAAYLTLNFYKNKELQEITKSLKTKFWKVPIIAEEGERI